MNLSKEGGVDMEYGVGRYFDSIVERINLGRQEGIQTEKTQTTFRLFDLKFQDKEIAEIVYYPIETVIQIKKELLLMITVNKSSFFMLK